MIQQYPKIFEGYKIKTIEVPIVCKYKSDINLLIKDISENLKKINKMTEHGYIDKIIKKTNISEGVFTFGLDIEYIVSIVAKLIHPKYGHLLLECKIYDIQQQAIRATYGNIVIVMLSNLIKNDAVDYTEILKVGDTIDIFVYQESLVTGSKDIYVVGFPFVYFKPQNKYRIFSSIDMYESPVIAKKGGKKDKSKVKTKVKLNDLGDEIIPEKIQSSNDDYLDTISDSSIDNPYELVVKKYGKKSVIDELSHDLEPNFDDKIFDSKYKKGAIPLIYPEMIKDHTKSTDIAIYVDNIKNLEKVYNQIYPNYKKIFIHSILVIPFTFIVFGTSKTNKKSEKMIEFDKHNFNVYLNYVKEWKVNVAKYSNIKKTQKQTDIIKEFKKSYLKEWEKNNK